MANVNLEKASLVGGVLATSFETKEAVVTFDDARTKVDALRKATATAGYPSMVKQ